MTLITLIERVFIGQIAQLTGSESGNKSPLAVEMCVLSKTGEEIMRTELIQNVSARFVMMLSSIAIVFAVVFLVIGVTTVYKGKATQTFTFAVSVLVAFVPEGLPSTVTLLCVYHRLCLDARHSTCLGYLLPRSAWLPKTYWSRICKEWRL
jgi:magnesium-transporting ATPase (P-type)